MLKIAILGGMSYESTLHYYGAINRLVNQRLGANNTADLIIESGNFQEIVELMEQGDWAKITLILAKRALGMQLAGAEKLVIATNTIHKVADDIEIMSGLEVIHIADCVAQKVREAGVKKVGFLGTRTTMTEDFMKQRLIDKGLEVFVPDNEKDIALIDEIIFKELCVGVVRNQSKKYLDTIIRKLEKKYKIEGLILGCTELGMIVEQQDHEKLPIFDTTAAHTEIVAEIIIESYTKKLKR